MRRLTPAQAAAFRQTIFKHFSQQGRDLPWRTPEATGSFDPYKILISEIMLQQTQVPRVIPKFTEFLAKFPTLGSLAAVPLSEVLKVWQGLGYNRRAKFLWQAARMITEDFDGVFPRDVAMLQRLPGIGPNTAGAVLAYAFNQPAIFVETNIRTVYIHHFFKGQTGIADADIKKLLEQTLDYSRPRQFYWALMDYGTYLKSTVGNTARHSKHYVKQSSFAGSRRALRGQVIRLLSADGQTLTQLSTQLNDERLVSILEDLTNEGLIAHRAGRYYLA